MPDPSEVLELSIDGSVMFLLPVALCWYLGGLILQYTDGRFGEAIVVAVAIFSHKYEIISLLNKDPSRQKNKKRRFLVLQIALKYAYFPIANSEVPKPYTEYKHF